MFFGTLGGIPELDAKGVKNDGTSVGGLWLLDPWRKQGDIDPGNEPGHEAYVDELGPRNLAYEQGVDLVPREPATIIHNSNPNPSEAADSVTLGSGTTVKGIAVKNLITKTGVATPNAPYTVKIVEFGLIPHPELSVFGASPDGICDEGSPNGYTGRMLEIKCPPKRKFTHEVPQHYWMQMQGQLEVCDLEECDFFQVKLEEYDSKDDYLSDYLEVDG